jgi:hypothetical protein
VAFAQNLDDATVSCLREVIRWLSAGADVTGPEAYALASMAVSLRVTQYANQTGSAYTSHETRTAGCPRLESHETGVDYVLRYPIRVVNWLMSK